MQIEYVLPRRPDQMSGGEAQRVAVALAMAGEPRILLLDEPRSQIDPHSLELMDDVLDEFLDRSQATCILITHSSNEAAKWADRVAIMNEGAIVQQAPFEDLYRCPATPAIAIQTGDVAFVAGVMTNADTTQTALGPLHVFEQNALGSSVKLVLRPENVVCDSEGPIAARVTSSRFVQGRWLLGLIGQGERIYSYSQESVPVGMSVRVRILEPIWALQSGSALSVGSG